METGSHQSVSLNEAGVSEKIVFHGGSTVEMGLRRSVSLDEAGVSEKIWLPGWIDHGNGITLKRTSLN